MAATGVGVSTALPANWAEANDPGSGKAYYWNMTTKETRWERPGEDVAAADALINSEFVQVAAGPIPAYEGQALPAALNTCLLRPIAAAAGTIRCYIMIKPGSLFNQYSFYIERNQKSDYAIAFTSAMLYEASRPSRANNMYAAILAYEEQRTDWRLAPLPANMGGWQRIFEFAGLYGIAPRETLNEDMLIMTAQDSPKKVIIKDPYGRELGTLE
jgi:hypothetical protein